MGEISIVNNIPCYELDGVVYLHLETVARGLGFTRIAASGNEVVRWETVRKYLSELGVPTSWHGDSPPVGKDGLPEYIPENIFYRLAMKAKNETAEKFQALVADEVIPQIRRTGSYSTGRTTRSLTTDDYLKAAQIVANCRNERLPYVMSFLKQAGITVPEKELAALNAKQPDTFLTKAERDAIVDEAIDILLTCPLTVREMARRTNIQPENKLSQYRHGSRRPSVQRAQHIIAVLKDVNTNEERDSGEVTI